METSDIEDFDGEYGFLSNFYMLKHPMIFDGIAFPTSEHAFQAAKCRLSYNRLDVAQASGPGAAKRLGRQIPIRNDWEYIKIPTMRRVLYTKFASDEELAAKLLATGDAYLMEGNNHGDSFWGVFEGKGLNHLGHLLMVVRRNLR
jgi:ribA/ribD-fused uncharacterized protein